MRSGIAVLLCVVSVLAPLDGALGEEGMWEIDRLDGKLVKRMESMGLGLSSEEIFDGKGSGIAYAILDLRGGTGSFVSPKGLILTNHHVAFTALQRASTAEHNYIEDGFHAGRMEDEIEAPGYQASVLLSIEDVTGKVLSVVRDDMGGLERYNAIEDRIKEIIAEAERDRDVECRISEFHGGIYYKLFTYFTIKDIRIVNAPPRSIGNYGGDIDNWMWPRHTGDFSFLRAYVAPDGSSAEYAAENIPYEPRVFLPVSTQGIAEGDFTMILGYPARTMRYRTSYSIAYQLDFYYPRGIELFGDLIGMIKDWSARDETVAIKLASYDSRFNNSMKNYQGQLEGFEKAGLYERKIAEEREFTEWLDRDEKMRKKYGDVLPGIAALHEEQKSYREKAYTLRFMGFVCQMLRAANTIERWSEEKEKPDLERKHGYQERDVQRLRRGLRMIEMSYDERVDRDMMRYFFDYAQSLPAGQRIEAIDGIIAAAPGDDLPGKIDAAIGKLYAGTRLASLDERNRMFDLTRGELLKEGDAFIDFARELRKESKVLEDRAEAFDGAVQKLRPRLIEAYQKWRGGGMYPDANGTMRLTFGTVKGYSPRDAVWYEYMTSLRGVIEKCTGEDPFDCPPELRRLYEERSYGRYVDRTIGDLPVDFLTTHDSTGGNSGSPVVNGRGEVVGATFDGNWEAISADYLFDEELTRSINVDSRYILFILEHISGAGNLLGEMTLL